MATKSNCDCVIWIHAHSNTVLVSTFTCLPVPCTLDPPLDSDTYIAHWKPLFWLSESTAAVADPGGAPGARAPPGPQI